MGKFIRAVVLVLALVGGGNSESFAERKKLEDGAIPGSAQKAYIGAYLMNIYDLNIASSSFYADFYLWCKWNGSINPLDDLEFVNYVEKSSFVKQAITETPTRLADGSQLMVYRIEARFTRPFNLAAFPLDRQDLDIELENSRFPIDSLVYLPLDDEKGISDQFDLAGWTWNELELISYTNRYNTNFGDISQAKETYSNLSINLRLNRPAGLFVWKLVLPLMVVMVSTILLSMLSATAPDVRISMTVASIASLVFLQLGYTSLIPETTYLVLIDKIYVAAYFCMFLSLVQTAYVHKLTNRPDADPVKIEKTDMRLSMAVFAFLLLTTVVLTLFR